MTTSPVEMTARRLLDALYEIENVIRLLSGDRRAAAIDLVTERVRRLREKRCSTPPKARPDAGSAQIDLEELLQERAAGARAARGTRASGKRRVQGARSRAGRVA